MRLLLAISLAFLYGAPLPAQRHADFALHWEYREYPQARSFAIPGFLFKFGALFVKNREERKLVRSIGKTRILMFEDSNPIQKKDLRRMGRKLENSGMDHLLSVRTKDEQIGIWGRERKGKIRKLVIMVSEEDTFVMVSMKGKIRLEDIGKLISDQVEKGKEKRTEKAEETSEKPALSILPVSVQRNNK